MLVNDWFEGDGPLADVGTGMTPVNLPLFGPSGPLYTDVYQTQLGDCTLMASLAEVAARDPQAIVNMFQNNGDGTYTVRFFDNGKPVYVTVNTELPDGGNIYDRPVDDLWAALAEKAVVELNESGWLQTVDPGSNSYAAIGSGNAGTTAAYLSAITGDSPSQISINPSDAAAAWNAGELVVLGVTGPGDPKLIVGQHAYAMVGYDASSSTPFELFNPWGVNGGTDPNDGLHYPGEIDLTAATLSEYFSVETNVSLNATPVSGSQSPAGVTANTTADPVAVVSYSPFSTSLTENSTTLKDKLLATEQASQQSAHDVVFSAWAGKLDLSV